MLLKAGLGLALGSTLAAGGLGDYGALEEASNII